MRTAARARPSTSAASRRRRRTDPPLPAGRQRPAGHERAAQGWNPPAVLGGWGNDTSGRLEERRRASCRTPRGRNVFLRGPGTKVSEHEWKNPAPEPDRPWLEPRNYGHWTVPMSRLYWQPNQALMVGGGLTRTSWGFHRYPWANMQSLHVLYSTGYNNVRAELPGPVAAQRQEPDRLARRAVLGNREHELLRLRKRDGDDRRQALYKTETNEYSIFPALRFRPGSRFELHVGRRGEGRRDEGRRQPGGAAAGVRDRELRRSRPPAGFEFDSRGRASG